MALLTVKNLSLGYDGRAIVEGLRRTGLPTETEYPLAELAAAVSMDKKLSGSTMHLIVPVEVGRCETITVPLAAIPDWLRAGGVR